MKQMWSHGLQTASHISQRDVTEVVGGFSADTLVSFVVGLSESDVTVAMAGGSFILDSNTIRWPLLKKSMAVTVLCKPEILKWQIYVFNERKC